MIPHKSLGPLSAGRKRDHSAQANQGSDEAQSPPRAFLSYGLATD